MSARVDKILALIDDGLLDVGKQSSDEHPFHLDSWYPMVPFVPSNAASFCGPATPDPPVESSDGYARSGAVRAHVCVPECEENAHVPRRTTCGDARTISDVFTEGFASELDADRSHRLDLTREVVYVSLHTEAHTPDDPPVFGEPVRWIPLRGVVSWVLVDGDGDVCASGEIVS